MAQAVQTKVVQRLLSLTRFRNEYLAFNGTFSGRESNDQQLILVWQKAEKLCRLEVDLNTGRAVILYTGDSGEMIEYRSPAIAVIDYKLHRPPLQVRLNMVAARHNVQSIEALARLADENGVESLNMIPLRPYGRSVKLMVDDMFDQSGFYAFIKHIQELRRRYRVQFITTLDLLDPEATTSHDLIVQKNSPVLPESRPR